LVSGGGELTPGFYFFPLFRGRVAGVLGLWAKAEHPEGLYILILFHNLVDKSNYTPQIEVYQIDEVNLIYL